MTDAEWAASGDPARMLAFLDERQTGPLRSWQLLCVGLSRLPIPWRGDPSVSSNWFRDGQIMGMVERVADDPADLDPE